MSGHPCVLISVVVARKEDKFCVTDERCGWYLPAGRVDFGECFTTAAVRESEEEAGLDAVLDGIYRLEFSAVGGYVRWRVVFAARARDPTKLLKQEADDETYGAEWFTLEQVQLLATKDKDFMVNLKNTPRIKQQTENGVRTSREKIRGKEVIHMFRWAEAGTKVFPLELYRGYDGNDIDNKIVQVSTTSSILIVVQDNESDKVVTTEMTLKKVDDFHQTAESMLKLFTKKNKCSSAKLTGICGLHHVAPKSKESLASMCICFTASATSQEVNWNPVEMYADKGDTVAMAVSNASKGIVAPLDFLAWEGSEHLVLS